MRVCVVLAFILALIFCCNAQLGANAGLSVGNTGVGAANLGANTGVGANTGL